MTELAYSWDTGNVWSCTCDHWVKWANDPFVPIWFNSRMNKNVIVYGKIAANTITIYYCPSCGGRMPKSRRGEFFETMSNEELREARAILEQITAVDTMYSVLGEPDDVCGDFKNEYGELLRNPNGPGVIRQYTYKSRWKSLRMIVQEYEDGQLQFFFYGQPKDMDTASNNAV